MRRRRDLDRLRPPSGSRPDGHPPAGPGRRRGEAAPEGETRDRPHSRRRSDSARWRARGVARGGLRRLPREANRRARAAAAGSPSALAWVAPWRTGCWRPGLRGCPMTRSSPGSRQARRQEALGDAHATRRMCTGRRCGDPADRLWQLEQELGRERDDSEGGQPLRDHPDRGQVPPGHLDPESEPDDVSLGPGGGLQRRPADADRQGADQALVRDRQQGIQARQPWESDTPSYKERVTLNGDKGTLYFECHYIDPKTAKVVAFVGVTHQVQKIDGKWLIVNSAASPAVLSP